MLGLLLSFSFPANPRATGVGPAGTPASPPSTGLQHSQHWQHAGRPIAYSCPGLPLFSL